VSLKFNDLVSVFWIKARIRPTLNSIAESTNTKKVVASRVRLLKTNPNSKEIAKRVIQRSSAVSNKCKEEELFIEILIKIEKKQNKRKEDSLKSK